jgi:hypothetical protein
MDMQLLNLSKAVEIPSVGAKIISLDSNVTNIPKAQLSFNNILPNESKKTVSGWMYFYIKNNPNTLKFLLEISSNNILYWYDTLVVNLSLTNLGGTQTNIPSTFELEQNYPNPFNPSAKIKYSIPTSEFVFLKVFDVLGKEIKTLVNEYKLAGIYEVELDASKLPSGVYLYQLKAGSFIETKKMLLLK